LIESIATRRLELQPLAADDADDLAALLDDPLVSEWLGAEDAGGLRDRFAGWVGRRSADGSEEWLNWVARRRVDGRATGWVQATVRRDRAEVAYATLPARRRRGYTAEAVAAVVAWLGARVVEAHVAEENLGSAAVAKAAGLRRTDEVDDGEVVWRR
jgi:RimJ/RimL family protein N-acetyltransferase